MANVISPVPRSLDLPKTFPTRHEDVPKFLKLLVESLNRQNNIVSNATSGPVVTTLVSGQSPFQAVLSINTSFYACNASAGADFILDLPAAMGTQLTIIVKKVDANAHNIVITAAGSDTIDGSSTFSISTQYISVNLIDAAVGTWLIY